MVGGNVTVEDTFISGYDRGMGIYGAKSRISGCTIRNNSVGLEYSAGDHIIIDSWIYSNVDGGIDLQESGFGDDDEKTTVDARHNFWGSVNGPYHPKNNSAGWGDEVATGVDFSEWHTEEDFEPFGPGGEDGGTRTDGGDSDDRSDSDDGGDGDDDWKDALPLLIMGGVFIAIGALFMIGSIRNRPGSSDRTTGKRKL